MSNYTKRIISIVIITFAIPLTVYLTIKGIQYFSHGATANATLSFSQNPVVVNASTPTVFNLVLNASSGKVGFAAVKFTFDATKVNLTSEIVPTTLLKRVISQTTMAQANSSGSVTLILGLDPADINNAPSGSFTLGQFSMKAVGTGSSTLSFVTSSIQVVDMTAAAYTVSTVNSNVNIGGATAIPTATPIGTANPTATPTPTPIPTNVTTVPSIPTGLTVTAGNGSVTLHWNANPAGDNVDKYQMYEADQYLNLNVPGNQTSYTTTTDHSGAALVNGTSYSFRISAHNSAGYGNWTNAISITPTSGATAIPTATPTPTPTPTPTATATASTLLVNFNMKFQGISAQGANKTVTVVLKSGANTVYTNNNVAVTSNASGVYSGSFTPNVSAGTYDVYLKDSNHLQKKIASVNLVNGSNSKDFSASPLLAGDFNNDNTITIADIAQELSHYTALSVPVDSTNAVYDVDGNGIINIIDISLVLSNYTALTVPGD